QIGSGIWSRLVGTFQLPLEVWESAWVQMEPRSGAMPGTDSNRVFIVHGRDTSRLAEVSQRISGFGLDPVILSEVAARGRTLIQKLEDEGEACFTVVLMTPDDLGHLAIDNAEQRRARQNVVFELGYFVGLYGRERVAVLSFGEIEWPSDWNGVEHIA